MKKNIILIITFLTSLQSFSQIDLPTDRFTVSGGAKLIASWTGKDMKDGIGKLSSGEKIEITTRQVGVFVSVQHKNSAKQIVATGDEESLTSTEVKVYEYDFDKDGVNEIMVVHSMEYSLVTVEVFRYQAGMSERVGNFTAQFEIALDGNSIYLPYGSFGLGDKYLYIDGAFFGLIYHDPNSNLKK